MALKRSPGGSAIYDARRRRATALSGEQLSVPGAEPLARQHWNTDHWETPFEVVHTLEEEFGPFYLDPCATAENRKAPNWWDERDDGLRQPWTGPAFCNPPYSSIDVWIRKAVAERARVVHARDDAEHQRKRVNALRGVVTRTKKRIANGTCPCCTRTFTNLARHIAAKHPDYVEAVDHLG